MTLWTGPGTGRFARNDRDRLAGHQSMEPISRVACALVQHPGRHALERTSEWNVRAPLSMLPAADPESDDDTPLAAGEEVDLNEALDLMEEVDT